MSILKESYKYFKKYLPLFLLFMVVGWCTLLCYMLLPQLIQLIIDRVITPAVTGSENLNGSIFSPFLDGFAKDDYYGKLGVIFIALGIILLIRFITHYARWNCSHYFGVKCERELRNLTFHRMITQNTSVLNRYTQGELMSIANSDPVMIKDMYVNFIPILSDQFVAIGISTYFLFRLSPFLAIAPLVFGIFLSISTAMYTSRLKTVFNDIRNTNVALNSNTQETINGIKIIKAFNRAEFEIDKFGQKNEQYKKAFFSHAEVWSKYQAVFSTLGLLINIASLIIGIVLGVRGKLSVGEFTTFVSYVALINNPMIQISNLMGNLQQTIVCGNRLFTFLNTENIIRDIDRPARITDAPDYELYNVCVNIDGKEVLKNLNLSLPYGKKLGIMGRTGSGKSALLKTLSRNFEATQGNLLINGTNIKNTMLDDVRRQFSYVMQDVFLFSNTVDANIAFYNPNAPHEEVVRVAKHAEADKFIRALSEGYNTIVGERGLGLSGGQKQRVSIARALLKNAPIIMLDDCTSALDMETERKILNNIREHYAERTVLITSHRASSVAFCDEIIFLENGEIAERGTHAELMKKNGRYAEIYNKQAVALIGGV